MRTENGGRTWIRQASGTTTDLYAVAVIDRRTAWIAGDTDNGYAVVLRTTNGGWSWKRQGTASTRSTNPFIDLSAVNARTAWAVGANGWVSKTADGGASWKTQMGSGLDHNNGVCAVDPKTAWIAADYNTIYRTADGGAHWNRLDPSVTGTCYLLGVSALGRNTAWMVGGAMFPPDRGIILRTEDAGVTWQIQSTPVDVSFRRASFVGSNR